VVKVIWKRRKVAIKRVVVVVNPLSGSAGADAPAEAERILTEAGLKPVVLTPGDEGLVACLQAAMDAKPDLVVIIAGDGTARLGAEMAGPKGPLVAPLPGGTMNMLPRALYGDRDWKTALTDILAGGVEKAVSGGEVEGRRFYVAAILGSPALWARAREAVREGRLRQALLRARRALHHAFSGRLRFSLDGSARRKTEALVLMTPLVSKAMDETEGYLEAAALDPTNALEVFRLGLHAAQGDWRSDPAVAAGRCRAGRVWAGSHIPAVLDGEPARLGPVVDFRFLPKAFRALVPAPETAR
jgi:diacylglycerol kinase family enzyme